MYSIWRAKILSDEGLIFCGNMIMEREGGGTKYSTMCYNMFSNGTVAEHRLQLAPTKKSSEQITSSISGM